MISLDGIIVTAVEQPMMVFSKQGQTLHMKNRKSFGLSLCLDGQITYEMDGARYVSDADHAVILPSGASYTLYRDKTGTFPLVNFQCCNFSCDTFLVLPLQNPQASIKSYELLRKLFLFPENNLRIYSAFYELLAQICDKPTTQQGMLTPSIHYLKQHLTDPALSNAILAEQAGISEVYFRKLFARQFRTTPKQYILDARLRLAMQLLTDADHTVSNIAELCGFTSVYHFCRAFKQRTGLTPTQYAAENRIYNI